MSMKVYSIGANNQKILVLGLFLGLVATLLVTSFYYVHNHKWYWEVAPLIGVVIVVSAAFGGLLVGHSLAGTQERRLWLVGLGGIFGFACIASGTVAASLGFWGMNYLPHSYMGWDSYSTEHLASWVNISLLQFSTATGLLGGFSIGFGLVPKSNMRFKSLKAIVRKEANN